jgi:hypothetical protein
MLSSLFANPWVLATLAAASLPFIIEWLFRRRKQQIELPTLKFLLENEEQEQIKKQDRILLILRTVGVIALVLAISRPLIQQSWLKGSGQRNVIIFIDNTASMNQQVGVDTSFRLAQKKAADIAANLPKDTPIAVGCLTDRAETVIDGEKDVNAVSSKIKAMKASAGAAPMSEGFTWIKEALERSGRSSAEVYLFSDMQKYSWKRPGAQAGEETKGFSELSSKCELYLVDVGGSPTFNYIVTDFAPVEWIVSTGMPAKFRATVEVKGKPPAGKKPTLTFLVDNQKKDVREIEVSEDKPVVVTATGASLACDVFSSSVFFLTTGGASTTFCLTGTFSSSVFGGSETTVLGGAVFSVLLGGGTVAGTGFSLAGGSGGSSRCSTTGTTFGSVLPMKCQTTRMPASSATAIAATVASVDWLRLNGIAPISDDESLTGFWDFVLRPFFSL